ncbi:MAG TPA: TonB-dependent receptor, partial [Chitinophagaceae bacterium]|nr:TonB-dependent receptor [Chitinophagaceae bacterium]
NDTRAILFDQSKSIVPTAYGSDLGIIFKPAPNLLLNIAAWYLFLEDELVFVGDEGIVEESGKTRRIGIDASARYQFNNWLFADFNINFSKPRSIDATKGEDFIPLAPALTSSGGLSWKMKNGLNGSLMYRYMKTRPANEDNSIKAHGYTLADLSFNYTRKKYEGGIAVENLFNVKWNEAQFVTNSRLKNESAAVEELHFTPGVPFAGRFKLAIFF